MKLRGLRFSDQELVEGGEDAERRARDEERRERLIRIAMSSGKPCLAAEELQPAHLSLLEHRETGEFFVVSRGEQDGEWAEFAAYFIARDGSPVFLERPSSGPASRAELAEQQAEQEQRRNAPRPRPAWMQ